MAGAGPARPPLLLLLLALCTAVTRALYFHIGETEKRCFIEEIPDETMVIGQEAAGLGGRRRYGPPGGHGPESGRALTSPGLLRRKLPHADVGQAEGGFPALDPRLRHARGSEGPRRQGRPS